MSWWRWGTHGHTVGPTGTVTYSYWAARSACHFTFECTIRLGPQAVSGCRSRWSQHEQSLEANLTKSVANRVTHYSVKRPLSSDWTAERHMILVTCKKDPWVWLVQDLIGYFVIPSKAYWLVGVLNSRYRGGRVSTARPSQVSTRAPARNA